MENDFVVLLNELPIECNKKFIESNFGQLYRSSAPSADFLLSSNQRSIQIDGGNDFYEVTKDIFQGNDFEISNDNFNYLDELSKKINSKSLQTKLNSFLYDRECYDHQIDQRPYIQFLVELSTLVHQLTLKNYEDNSSQIKQKLIPYDINSTKGKGKKSNKKKGRKNQKKKRELDEEEEINEEEKMISLENISKKTLSKLFYYEIVNNLSANFHSNEELQEHQSKVDLVIQLIKDLDSNSEEDDESDTYLNDFINYVVKKYSKIINATPTISNHLQETLYLINYLIKNDLLDIEKLQGENKNNTSYHKFMYPEYFLHFYPKNMITKYFKNHGDLLTKESAQSEKDNNKRRKGKKGVQQKNDSVEDQIQEYLQHHQKKVEEGFAFDDDLLNIIIDDNLDEFKSYLRKKVSEKINSNKQERKKEKVTENTIINSFVVPPEICKFSCISAFNNSSTIFDLSAFFGSKSIFNYLNNKQGIKKSSNFLSYIVAGNDSQIIKLYLSSLGTQNQNIEAKEEDKNYSDYDSMNSDYDEDDDSSFSPFNNNNNNNEAGKDESDDGYIKEDKNAFNTFNQFYYQEDDQIDSSNEQTNKEEIDTKLVINAVKSLMPLCIDLCNLDLYMFLYNYLLQYAEKETFCTPDCQKLDSYMKRSVSRSYFEIIPNLLKEGATADILLNLFCKTSNEIGIEYMLEFSYINVNNTYNSKTALEYCIDNKNERASLLLLNTDKIKQQNETDYQNQNDESYIILACKYGLSRVVKYLLQKNLFDVNDKTKEGIRPIHFACKSGSFETVQAIIEEKKRDVKINGKVTKGEFKGFTPLHFACLSGNPDIVSLLIECRANINLKDGTKKWTPLQYAVLNGHAEAVSILLDQKGIETDMITKEEENLLHLGCMSNNEDVVDNLINNPNVETAFDLNAKTMNKRTPLQIALLNGNINMISVLLNIDIKSKKKGNKNQSNIDPNALTNNGQAPLIIACEMRRVDIFNLLLKHSEIDINIQSSTGKTALYVACELNLVEIVEELLRRDNINVNAATKIGKTPLIIACEKGNKEIVELFINYNSEKSKSKNKKQKTNLVDFNAKTTDGKSALLIACEYLRMNIAEILVDIDEIECDDASDDGKTPLCYACEKGSEYLASHLIDHYSNVNQHTKDNRTPLYFACLSRNSIIIQNILSKIDNNSQINLKEETNGTTPLLIACSNGDLSSFNLLINEVDENSDLNYQDNQGRSLLFAACEGENSEIVEILLKKFNVDSSIADNEGKTCLHVACEKKNTEIVYLILNHSSNEVSLNDKWNNSTALEIACEKGSIEIVQLLIKQEGIQVNQTNKNEVPPLLCACEIWRADIIKLLLNEVPDINIDVPHSDGRTPLHYACEKGDVEISDIILSRSTKSISLRTSDKKTPIELACQNEHVEVINLLLKYVDDMQINAKFFDGNTILTKACIQQSVDVVKLLLESTVIDVNATNNAKRTALFIVAKNGNEQICQMLLNHKKIDMNILYLEKTVLYEACKYGNVGVAEMLIKKGARADCLTKNGKTPLHVACQHGFNQVVALLLNCPEVNVNLLTHATPEQIKNKYYKTFYAPIHLACSNKNYYSHHYRPPPQHFNNPYSHRNMNFGSNSHNDSYDDYDPKFNQTRLAISNHQLCVELLVHHPNVDVNIQTSKHETSLTIACQSQKFDIIKTLLQSPKINPNTTGSYNNTALHIACQRGKINIVEMLLNIPKTDVNCKNVDNETPISIACDQNRTDIVKLLLDRDDLVICKIIQENPIRKVIQKNNSELFKILIHHPSFDVNQSDKNSVTPLGYAIESQNINFVLQLLLIPGIDVNKKSNIESLNLSSSSNNNNGGGRRYYGRNNNDNRKPVYSTPLSMALKINNYQIVKMIVQFPFVDINEYACGKTALHSSIISDNSKITSLLLSSQTVDVNLITKFDESPIRLLVNYERGNQTNDPFLFGQSALHIACYNNNVDAVRELIKHEDLLVNEYTNAYDISCLDKLKKKLYSSLNTQNMYRKPDIKDTELSVRFDNKYRYDCNALFIAASENNSEIVSLLLLRDDIDINARSTNEKMTPLHVAAKKGYLDVVKILLSDDRCDSQATSKDGTNILTFACQSHNMELLRMIMSDYGSLFVNSLAENGDTLYHYACRSNDVEIFKVLLDCADKKKFDINVTNKKGETLLHLASKFDVPENLYRRRKKSFLKTNTIDEEDEDDSNYEYINDYKTKTIFGLLLDNGADINLIDDYGQTPLFVSCSCQNYSNIDILLREKEIIIENPNSFNLSPFNKLLVAVVNTHYKYNSNMNEIESSFDGGFGGFSGLFGRNNYSNTRSSTTTSMTVPKRLIKTVCNLIDRGANYKAFDHNTGLSLLHFAIICKSKKLVKFYLDNSSESEIKSMINCKSEYGKPIQVAMSNWNENIMSQLISKKEIIEFTDQMKEEIVFKCALNNDAKTLMILLCDNDNKQSKKDFDLNVNYFDKEKGTSLHVAVYNCNSIIASILSNYDYYDTNVLDKDGKSALHRACMNRGRGSGNDSQFVALAILTQVELHTIKEMYDKDDDFNCSKFNKYLLTQLNSLNPRIDINIVTKGMTRKEFFRIERQKILKNKPNTTRFHIWYHEPEYNIGFTPLIISVSNRQNQVVKKILLFESLDINAVSSHGDTALTMAAKNWNEQIVKLLIDYPGANFNYIPKDEDHDEYDDGYDDYGNHKEREDPNKKTDPNRPDHTLTSQEIYEIKRKKRNQRRTLLHAACQNDSLDIVKRLLKMSEDGVFDINAVDSFDEMAPLHYICENGNEKIFYLFVDYEKRHPNVIDWNIKNKNGMTPLHFAARGKQAKIVDELINNEIICPHVDINAIATGEFENGRTPLSFACEKGELEIVNLLLNDKNENENKNDPFYQFAAKTSSDLESKKNVKRGSLCGAKSQCDLTIKSKAAHQKGMTALHYACKSSNIEVVKLILNHGGFDINARANGKSCLFLACKHNRADIVKLLLQQNDINYNIKTPRGVTPLMIAAQEGRTTIVEMLLRQRRIDKSALTADGQSAKDMAKNSAILDLFEKYA